MANICKNVITIVGLKEASETFVKALAKAMFGIDLDAMDPTMWGEDPNIDGKTFYRTLTDEYRQEGVYAARYGVLYPEAAYSRLGVTAPRHYLETKWKPPFDELSKASKTFPEPTFHLAWWLMQDGPNGETVMKNGEVVEVMRRRGSWYLFDPILFPTVSLLPAHMAFTLAQYGALRVEDAIHSIEDLRNILDDDRFLASPHTPFSACRDKEKTEKLRAALADLHESMVEQAKRLDFEGVFLEEHELREKLPRILEADKALMENLGLKPLLPLPGEAVRFSIVPFKVAATDDPYRAIVPVVHYLNADPSGKYVNRPDGSPPPIEWETGYVCLTRIDMMQIRRLPDAGQTPYDIDIVMTPGNREIGFDFNPGSNRARWKRNPELAVEVERKASEMSDVFATKIAGKHGITIFADFQAVVAALFPESVK
jgi:hypothetical protein